MIRELTNHLWQSTFFAMAAGLLTLAFRKNRAHVRYWVWFAASVKFVTPFALLIDLGRLLPTPAVRQIATPAVSFAVEQISQPFSTTLPAANITVDWIPLAMLVAWACGFAAVAAIRLRGWLRVCAALRSSVPFEIPTGVAVRCAAGLLEPGVVGWLRPVLLLPAGIAERLTTEQLEAVLAHELCHIRRRDNLFSAIHMVAEAIFWFHPLVWWIGARLVEERERACDEGVLHLGSQPGVYAEAILNICKLYVESPLACVAGVTGSDLKKRIEGIMANRNLLRLNLAKKAALAIAGMAAVAAPVVVGLLHAPAMRAQPRTMAAAPPAVPPAPQPRAVPIVPRPAGKLLASQVATQAIPGTADDVRQRRQAEAVAMFGDRPGAMGRVYVQFGPPDQKFYSSDGMASSETWRYNYLEVFHSNVEFEFPEGKANLFPRINWPLPAATFDGEAAEAEPKLVDALNREALAQGKQAAITLIAGLPVRHASFQIYPVDWYRKLVVPLDSLSGRIDIAARIEPHLGAGDGVQNVAMLRDSVSLQMPGSGIYQANFTLPAGAYTCHLIVREQSSGRVYGETINFEVK